MKKSRSSPPSLSSSSSLTVNRQEIHRRVVPEERLALAPRPRPLPSRVRAGFLRVQRVGVEALGADREQLPPLFFHERGDGRGPVADGCAAPAAAGLVDEVLCFFFF